MASNQRLHSDADARVSCRLLALKKKGDLEMKSVITFLVVTFLFLAGCEYEAPLTKEHTIPVDLSLLGLWEFIPEEGEESDSDERMMILKFSDTECLIHYPIGEDGLYLRAYLIKIGNVSCVQLQAIGTADGPPEKDERELYHVVSYVLADGILEVKLLNTDLVDDDLKNSEALREAFLKHQDDKDLFTNPGRFRRVKDSS